MRLTREWEIMKWGLENVIANVDEWGELESLQEHVQFGRAFVATHHQSRALAIQNEIELRAMEWIIAHAGQPFTIEVLVAGVFPDLMTAEREDLSREVARGLIRRRRQDEQRTG